MKTTEIKKRKKDRVWTWNSSTNRIYMHYTLWQRKCWHQTENKTTTNHQNGNSTIGFVWPHLNRSVRALERTNMVLYISNYTFLIHSWLRSTTATHRLRKKSRSDHSQIVTKYINYAEPKCNLFKLISNQIWSPEEIFALFIVFDLLDWVPNSSVKSYACFGIGCDQY